ncbi:MAG: hypothetical protein WCD18_19615 [Thermosynechococcaceae cyanobacterium]
MSAILFNSMISIQLVVQDKIQGWGIDWAIIALASTAEDKAVLAQ